MWQPNEILDIGINSMRARARVLVYALSGPERVDGVALYDLAKKLGATQRLRKPELIIVDLDKPIPIDLSNPYRNARLIERKVIPELLLYAFNVSHPHN